jgi:hypothetical protein
MPLTAVASLELEMLELNSQKWIYSFLLQAHICWLFAPSDFNTIGDLSRHLMLPVQGAQKLYPFNPLNPELNPICYLLALLGAHHFLHVSTIRG